MENSIIFVADLKMGWYSSIWS